MIYVAAERAYCITTISDSAPTMLSTITRKERTASLFFPNSSFETKSLFSFKCHCHPTISLQVTLQTYITGLSLSWRRSQAPYRPLKLHHPNAIVPIVIYSLREHSVGYVTEKYHGWSPCKNKRPKSTDLKPNYMKRNSLHYITSSNLRNLKKPKPGLKENLQTPTIKWHR